MHFSASFVSAPMYSNLFKNALETATSICENSFKINFITTDTASRQAGKASNCTLQHAFQIKNKRTRLYPMDA